MLDIQRSLKKIIERFIAQVITVTEDVVAGATTIKVASTRRFMPGDYIIIRERDSMNAAPRCITAIPDHSTIIIDTALSNDYPSNDSVVQKILGYEAGIRDVLKAVYLGDPAVIQLFPAITINGRSRTSEWLTLESVSHKYDVDITVYVDGTKDFESQYTLMHYYTRAIENSLFRTFYPLVEPYRSTVLTEDVDSQDDTIQVDDVGFFRCGMGWIFIESVDFLVPNRAEAYLGNGILQLVRPVGKDFTAGDIVIHPLRHVYNSMLHSTNYGTIMKNTALKAAQMSWSCNVEQRLFTPYIDPLTF